MTSDLSLSLLGQILPVGRVRLGFGGARRDRPGVKNDSEPRTGSEPPPPSFFSASPRPRRASLDESMGNASARPPASGQQQLYVADPARFLKEDMPQIVVIRRIGNGRFMKSYLCREEGVELVVKAMRRRRIVVANRPLRDDDDHASSLSTARGTRAIARAVGAARYARSEA